MELSSKMPSTMDSTLPASMPSKMASDAPATGGTGPMNPPVIPISRDTQAQDAEWVNLTEKSEAYWTEDKKTGSGAMWECTPRIETEQGSVPQRS